MKILHVVPSLALSTGGPAVNAIALARQMDLRGHTCHVLTTDIKSPSQAAQVETGATVGDFPAGAELVSISIAKVRQPHRLVFSPGLMRTLLFESKHYDVVHVHSANQFPQFAVWCATLISHTPYIVSPRGALDPWIRRRGGALVALNDWLWHRRMLNGSSLLHFTTEEERTLVAPMQLTSPSIVLPNGLDIADLATVRPDPTIRDRWLDGFAGFVIMNHGRLSEKKGLDLLVRAAGTISRGSGPDFRLVFIGPDEEGIGSRLRAIAAEYDMAEKLRLIPPQTGSDLQRIVQAADVWVLPSHTENFGMAVVEAMAAARPVIATPAVNIAPDAASEDALVMCSNDPEELARQIVQLMNDPDRRRQLGDRGRVYSSRFDWSALGDRYENMYRTVATLKTG